MSHHEDDDTDAEVQAVTTAAPDEERQDGFYEILSRRQSSSSSSAPSADTVDVYVARVTPHECGPLVKKLGKRPSSSSDRDRHDDFTTTTTTTTETVDLSHLRRVRRRTHTTQATDEGDSDPKSSSTATANLELHVLLGAVRDVDRHCRLRDGGGDDDDDDDVTRQPQSVTVAAAACDYFQSVYGVEDCTVVSVPSRPAESLEECRVFDRMWPTLYFPHRTREHARRQRRLTAAESRRMRDGMRAALDDALGAVVVDPTSGTVMSRAQQEDAEQRRREIPHPDTTIPSNRNPLATPVLLAIQGVSRQERDVACRVGMDHPTFHKGQYLCTGFDCYTVREPTAFEAMSLVHARIRRVVFGVPRPAGQGGGLRHYRVHGLPHTNHRYRAFYCAPESELSGLCQAYLDTRKDSSS